ncbi:MAG: hypothetical protein WCS70_07210 [Verrucomicrobiota bacterium]
MLVKITRGLGGPKGLLLLSLTIGVGVVLLISAGFFRHRLLKPKGVPATALPPEKVVVLGDQARGPSAQVPYLPGEHARVSANAAARQADNQWISLAQDLILNVTESKAVDGETWVTGRVAEGAPVTVHASFLERYKPVVLANLVELSDVRLSIVRDGANPGTGVAGWLRNISGQTLSQCLVTCVFQDVRERTVDSRRATSTDLPPGVMVPFQTVRSEKAFAQIAVQIMYATPDGLREFLPTVVIQKSSLQ